MPNLHLLIVPHLYSAVLAMLCVVLSAGASAKPFDFDGDGRADVLWRNGSEGQSALWRMAGTTAVSMHFVLSDGAWAEAHVGDFNNDGRTDIVWRNVRTGWTAIWLMNGSAPTATAVLMTDPAWEVTHVGDFDGDRRADLVWRHATTGATSIWIMNGTQLTTSRVVLSDPAWRVTHVADADGNGRADLVWRKADTGETSLWLMNGTAPSSTGQVVKSVDWIVTHAADFNGDNRADFVARNVKTGETAVWLHNGLTRIGGATVFTDRNWLVEFTGDFNGDGRADLLWRHARTGVTAVWLMNGAALVTANTLLSSGQWRVVQVADFDGDTRDDLLWVNHELGGTSMWLMNGAVQGATQYLHGDRRWVPTAVGDRTRLLGHGTPATRDAARLMAQATFGTTPAEVSRAQSIGLDAWINEQFAKPQTLHLPWVRAELAAGREEWEVVVPSLWRSWFEGNDQLRQRVAFALSEILVVSLQNDALLSFAEAPASFMDVLAQHAFGNFRSLLEAVTLHPAMGHYLDMKGSQRQDDVRGLMPNENYARELLQLFSIGTVELNVDGTPKTDGAGRTIPTYSEAVVQGFARAFTGFMLARQDDAKASQWACWRWDYPQSDGGRWAEPMQHWKVPACGDPQYRTDFHEYGPKTLLSYPGAPHPTLAANLTPAEDIRRAMDNIFHHPNVGPFIGRQLIQRLVTSNPSPGYVARIAAAFANDGTGARGNLGAVVRAILLDPEARSPTLVRDGHFGKLREPAIKFATFHRNFGARSTNGKYYIWAFDNPAESPGQTPLRAPSVFNFFSPSHAPTGRIAAANLVAPEFQLATSSSVTGWSAFSRWGMIDRGFYGATADPLYNFTIAVDYAPYAALADNPAHLIDRLDDLFLAGQMSDGLKLALIDAVYKLTLSDATDRLDRVRMPLWQILMSPDWTVQK